jgi:hypothetical protein
MTAVTASPAQIDLGRVIAAGFGLLRRRPLAIFSLAILLAFLPAIASVWLTTHLVGATVRPGAPGYFSRLGALELVQFATAGVNWIFQGSIVLCAWSEASEHGFSAGDLISRLPERLPWLFAVGVVATAGVLLGTLALIVPGVLLSLAWCMAPAVTAVEDRSFIGQFRRSAELTRGNRGQHFGLFLLYGLVRAIAIYGLRFAVGTPSPLLVTSGADSLVYGLQPALSTVLSAIYAAVMAATYLELRGLKEGLVAGQFAATFD